MASLQELHAQSYSDMPFDDFARRYHQKFYSDMPYDEFSSKAGLTGSRNDKPAVSSGNDLAKSAVSGLSTGAVNTAGAIGDIRDLGGTVVGAGARKLGLSEDTAKTLEKVTNFASRLNPLTLLAPTSKQVKDAVTPFTGEFYQPQTTGGRFVGRAAEFIPGAVLGPGGAVRNAVLGASAGVGSEAAGTLTQGTSAEPYARIAGAVAGGLAPAIASRAITPLPIAAERQNALNVLEQEGVPLTAGQRTGYKPLQWVESTLGDLPGAGGAASAMQREQSQAFTRAALRRIGENADAATPEVMAGARTRIGAAFDDIASRAQIQMDQQFAREVGDTVTQYIRLSNQGQRPRLPDDIANALVGFAQNQGGAIAGDQLQSLRSMLTRVKTSDPELSQFVTGIRRALDDLVERTAGPGIAQEWRQARGEYRNMRSLEKAVGGAGENAALGLISPQMLRSSISSGNQKAQYVRGQGDLAELARAGNVAMPQLPQSGTAPRSFVQGLATGGGVLSGDPSVAIMGLLGPALTGRALMSRPVQAYLSNQVVPNAQNAIGLLSAPQQRLLSDLLRTRAALPIGQQ